MSSMLSKNHIKYRDLAGYLFTYDRNTVETAEVWARQHSSGFQPGMMLFCLEKVTPQSTIVVGRRDDGDSYKVSDLCFVVGQDDNRALGVNITSSVYDLRFIEVLLCEKAQKAILNEKDFLYVTTKPAKFLDEAKIHEIEQVGAIYAMGGSRRALVVDANGPNEPAMALLSAMGANISPTGIGKQLLDIGNVCSLLFSSDSRQQDDQNKALIRSIYVPIQAAAGQKAAAPATTWQAPTGNLAQSGLPSAEASSTWGVPTRFEEGNIPPAGAAPQLLGQKNDQPAPPPQLPPQNMAQPAGAAPFAAPFKEIPQPPPLDFTHQYVPPTPVEDSGISVTKGPLPDFSAKTEFEQNFSQQPYFDEQPQTATPSEQELRNAFNAMSQANGAETNQSVSNTSIPPAEAAMHSAWFDQPAETETHANILPTQNALPASLPEPTLNSEEPTTSSFMPPRFPSSMYGSSTAAAVHGQTGTDPSLQKVNDDGEHIETIPAPVPTQAPVAEPANFAEQAPEQAPEQVPVSSIPNTISSENMALPSLEELGIQPLKAGTASENQGAQWWSAQEMQAPLQTASGAAIEPVPASSNADSFSPPEFELPQAPVSNYAAQTEITPLSVPDPSTADSSAGHEISAAPSSNADEMIWTTPDFSASADSITPEPSTNQNWNAQDSQPASSFANAPAAPPAWAPPAEEPVMPSSWVTPTAPQVSPAADAQPQAWEPVAPPQDLTAAFSPEPVAAELDGAPWAPQETSFEDFAAVNSALPVSESTVADVSYESFMHAQPVEVGNIPTVQPASDTANENFDPAMLWMAPDETERSEIIAEPRQSQFEISSQAPSNTSNEISEFEAALAASSAVTEAKQDELQVQEESNPHAAEALEEGQVPSFFEQAAQAMRQASASSEHQQPSVFEALTSETEQAPPPVAYAESNEAENLETSSAQMPGYTNAEIEQAQPEAIRELHQTEDEVASIASGITPDEATEEIPTAAAAATVAPPARNRQQSVQDPRLVMKETALLMSKLEHQVAEAAKRLGARSEAIKQRLNQQVEELLDAASESEKQSQNFATEQNNRITRQINDLSEEIRQQLSESASSGRYTIKQLLSINQSNLEEKQSALEDELKSVCDRFRTDAENFAREAEGTLSQLVKTKTAEIESIADSVLEHLDEENADFVKIFEARFARFKERITDEATSVTQSLERNVRSMFEEVDGSWQRASEKLRENQKDFEQRISHSVKSAKLISSENSKQVITTTMWPLLKERRSHLQKLIDELTRRFQQESSKQTEAQLNGLEASLTEARQQLQSLVADCLESINSVGKQQQASLEEVFKDTSVQAETSTALVKSELAEARRQITEAETACRSLVETSNLDTEVELTEVRNSTTASVKAAKQEANSKLQETIEEHCSNLEKQSSKFQHDLNAERLAQTKATREASEAGLSRLREAIQEAITAVQAAREKHMD